MAARAVSSFLSELPRGVSLLDPPNLSRFEGAGGQAEAERPGREPPAVLSLGWPAFDALLPDGGLPRGVVELSSRYALGGPSRLAARAVARAQALSSRAHCAWLDPEGTLFSPGLARAEVALERLFVVRPPRAELERIAVKVVRSGAFEVVVVDMDELHAQSKWPPPYPLARPTATVTAARAGGGRGSSAKDVPARGRRPLPVEVVVRKLALAAGESGTTVLLLTDATKSRAVPWPVALRLELERRPDALGVCVAKDRHGRGSSVRSWVPLTALAAEEASPPVPPPSISTVRLVESPFGAAPEADEEEAPLRIVS